MYALQENLEYAAPGLYGIVDTLSQIPPNTIREECYGLLEDGVDELRQRPNVLHAAYAKAVLGGLRVAAHSFCEGCLFVDKFGHKGHPSQHRHRCLMDSDFELLAEGFTLAYMGVNRFQVARDFLKLF